MANKYTKQAPPKASVLHGQGASQKLRSGSSHRGLPKLPAIHYYASLHSESVTGSRSSSPDGYYLKNAQGSIIRIDREAVRFRLIRLGFSDERPQGGLSQVDEAIIQIQDTQSLNRIQRANKGSGTERDTVSNGTLYI